MIFEISPGVGPQLSPRLLVAFENGRECYQNACELQQYTGIATVIERSGKKIWTYRRYSCPTFLRQKFVEWAGFSMRYSF